MDGDVVSVERVIPAPPEKIFEYLADATKHPLIDGSGTVKKAKPGAPERLSLGSTFGMSMKLGVPYSMVSTVIEFEDNRRIAWQTKPPGVFRRLGGGRIWRYELEPVDGGTRVRESWDISEDHQRRMLRRIAAKDTAKNMDATLARIEELVTA
jgi:uncharacterized protein YndB with AHSA1/START domain